MDLELTEAGYARSSEEEEYMAFFNQLDTKEKALVLFGYCRPYLHPCQFDGLLFLMHVYDSFCGTKHAIKEDLLKDYRLEEKYQTLFFDTLSLDANGIDALRPFIAIMLFAQITYSDIVDGKEDMVYDVSCPSQYEEYGFSGAHGSTNLIIDERLLFLNTELPGEAPLAGIRDSLENNFLSSVKVKEKEHAIIEIDDYYLLPASDQRMCCIDKEVLVCGYLRREDLDRCIPDFLVQTCVQYLHDEVMERNNIKIQEAIQGKIRDVEQGMVTLYRGREIKRYKARIQIMKGCSLFSGIILACASPLAFEIEGIDLVTSIVIFSLFGVCSLCCVGTVVYFVYRELKLTS